MGDGGGVPGELEPGGGMGLHLQEVGGRGGALHGLALPGVPRGVHNDEGGGEGGAPVVPGDHEEAVERPDLQVVDLGSLSSSVQLLKLFNVYKLFKLTNCRGLTFTLSRPLRFHYNHIYIRTYKCVKSIFPHLSSFKM